MSKIDWSDLSLLIEQGLTLREIGRMKGCTHSSVRKAIKKYKINYYADKSLIAKMLYYNGGKEKLDTYRIVGDISELICEYCGNNFQKLTSTIKGYTHHFCSNHCKAKWIGNKLKHDIDYKHAQRLISLSHGNKPPILKGENHPKWKGGISKYDRGQDYNYIKWRKDVFAKYNYTCQYCGVRGGRLSSHHVKSWSEYPELRYDVNNGLCLCYDCHMELHGLNKKTA